MALSEQALQLKREEGGYVSFTKPKATVSNQVDCSTVLKAGRVVSFMRASVQCNKRWLHQRFTSGQRDASARFVVEDAVFEDFGHHVINIHPSAHHVSGTAGTSRHTLAATDAVGTATVQC